MASSIRTKCALCCLLCHPSEIFTSRFWGTAATPYLVAVTCRLHCKWRRLQQGQRVL
jgi:hypothetical protein